MLHKRCSNLIGLLVDVIVGLVKLGSEWHFAAGVWQCIHLEKASTVLYLNRGEYEVANVTAEIRNRSANDTEDKVKFVDLCVCAEGSFILIHVWVGECRGVSCDWEHHVSGRQKIHRMPEEVSSPADRAGKQALYIACLVYLFNNMTVWICLLQ